MASVYGLQFARLESLLQQAARSPGRQSWKTDGEDRVRAATGELALLPLLFAHCSFCSPLVLCLSCPSCPFIHFPGFLRLECVVGN